MLTFEANNGFTLRGKIRFHAFGYNSAENKPIWMASGALWIHCWGLALADFGRDPRSNDSFELWEAAEILCFWSGK